jgi:hypothetical protein
MIVTTAEQRRVEFKSKFSEINECFSEGKLQEIPENVTPLANDIAEKISKGCICKCSLAKLVSLLEAFDERDAGPDVLHFINYRLGRILSIVQ